jgi:flagellar biosynthetic protein FliP
LACSHSSPPGCLGTGRRAADADQHAGCGGSQTYTLSIQTLLTLTALTFLPAALLMMTSFTRIIIVLSLLRHALGTQTSPPNQVLLGLSLFLTFFIMSPVLDTVYSEAYLPLSENRISYLEAIERGRRAAAQVHAQTDA